MSHKVLPYTTSFNLNCEAFDLVHIGHQIHVQAYNHFGINIKIDDKKVSNFYTDKGGKITKYLRSLIKKTTKDYPFNTYSDDKFSEFGKSIRELYQPSGKINAYFVSLCNLGQGFYENKGTCFREGHENGHAPEQLALSNRNQMLILKLTDKDDTIALARCIAYFRGTGNIYLYNFYFNNGFPQQKTLFLQALTKMFKKKKAKHIWSTNWTPLVYQNGDTVRLRFKKEEKGDRIKRMLPCPNCNEFMTDSRKHSKQSNNTLVTACSPECCLDLLEEHCVDISYCDECDDIIADAEYNSIFVENLDITVCEDCYQDKIITFNCCGNHERLNNIHWDDDIGNYYCENCCGQCEKCEKTIYWSESFGYEYCDYCAECHAEVKHEAEAQQQLDFQEDKEKVDTIITTQNNQSTSSTSLVFFEPNRG